MTMPAFSESPPVPAGEDDIAGRLADVRRRIVAAAERAGRSASAVTLVAVSKGFPVDRVLQLRATGHADFGESRAQELRDKAETAGPGIRWHFVGPLQRNKVRNVVGVATLIHSVDRLPLAEAIAERARRDARVQRVLVQVIVAGERA
jgi:PLP dependent protein